ncbi:MAG: cysteine hydrolase [Crocinitomicaceae bacterium]
MKRTAIVLIGFQNDYFAEDGILTGVVEDTLESLGVLGNTISLLQQVPSDVEVISTPIVFSDDYSELLEPIGILKSIAELGAFKQNTKGAEVIPEIESLGDRIVTIKGKHGLNAFTDTDLEKYLREKGIEKIALAGCVCSICIDSTGRSAFDKGFDVIMLSDCITGRTLFEQEFYCKEVFPLYAKVMTSKEFVSEFNQ